MQTSDSSASRRGSRLVLGAVAIATIVAALLVVFGVKLNPDVVALLPSQGDAAVLARYLRGFGGGGIGVVLIEGEDPAETQAVADQVAEQLGKQPSVAFSSARLLQATSKVDPLLGWRAADPAGRERLAQALTPEGMRARLDETYKLLLAPGSGSSQDAIAADPLRLGQIPYESRAVGTGVNARTDGYFATEDGRGHVVIVKPTGQALRGAEARAFTHDVESVLEPLRREHPSLKIRVTGPHAVAAGMEAMLRSDLERSGAASVLFASIAFGLVFRRLRALAAILPPLALGTLWTGALAAAWPNGISAIAVAFTSIVVGVGFDTGVHVYAAVLEARREGLPPAEAARVARARTARPVLVAATIAGVAFASLSLSSVEALAQLGLLCAAGEVFTALAIVSVTPEIGAWLERGAPPAVRVPWYTRFFASLTATRTRAAVALTVCLLAGLSSIVTGIHVSDSLVAVRPSKLEALQVEARIFELFGGRPQPWIVLVTDADRDAAMHRADVIAERLAADRVNIERVDALTSVLPAEATQRQRFAERDALDLPAKSDQLRRALEEKGFAVEGFEAFLQSMKEPRTELIVVEQSLLGDLAVVASRYMAKEADDHLVALHVHLTDAPGARAAMDEAVHASDPSASVTGYARLELDLHAALAHDMPRIGAVAGALVLGLLWLSLRRTRDVALALGVLVLGLGALLGLVAVLEVPLHLYSALVIPVLLGISVDEAMFLLHHTREAEAKGEGGDVILSTLQKEAPIVITTALTTSAGLVALMTARYEGLRDLGIVGSVGNLMNLLVALLLVPAGLRLTRRR